MKIGLVSTLLLASSVVIAATPVDGMYAGVFGGLSYLPNNISQTRAGILYNNGQYQAGYNAGGSIGYKNTPIRFQGDIAYIHTNAQGFDVNTIAQTGVSGEETAIVGLANIFYDFSDLSPSIEPYLGMGVGFASLDSRFFSSGPFAQNRLKATNTVFAYQATAGLTYNFSENYALDLGYRYIGSARANEFGKPFQAHLLTLAALYRFDEANYK